MKISAWPLRDTDQRAINPLLPPALLPLLTSHFIRPRVTRGNRLTIGAIIESTKAFTLRAILRKDNQINYPCFNMCSKLSICITRRERLQNMESSRISKPSQASNSSYWFHKKVKSAVVSESFSTTGFAPDFLTMLLFPPGHLVPYTRWSPLWVVSSLLALSGLRGSSPRPGSLLRGAGRGPGCCYSQISRVTALRGL